MIIREEHLITINNKNRIQHVYLSLDQDVVNSIFTIERYTGQFGGKFTKQPVLEITKGKVKRTVSEQASLQFNSLLKNYLDKSYKKLSDLTDKDYKDLTEDEMKTLFGGQNTDQLGIPKPMLAKLSDQCSPDIFENQWFVSRKLDGVRCIMYFKDDEIHTASRGGGTYDAATKHLREDPELIAFFKSHPDVMLDGELYKHDINYPLQRISGLARLQEWEQACGALEYWIYDYVSNESFRDRYDHLLELKKSLSTNSKIKILEQIEMSGYLKIKKEHDKYVQEGFEGLCARNPDKEYGVNKRSANYLIKVKMRKDDEGEIVGIKEGLRPEDMCFILKTKTGIEFAAKPMGTVQTRLDYLNNKEKYIGQQATYTYFNLSSDGTPTQPVMKHIRPIDE